MKFSEIPKKLAVLAGIGAISMTKLEAQNTPMTLTGSVQESTPGTSEQESALLSDLRDLESKPIKTPEDEATIVEIKKLLAASHIETVPAHVPTSADIAKQIAELEAKPNKTEDDIEMLQLAKETYALVHQGELYNKIIDESLHH